MTDFESSAIRGDTDSGARGVDNRNSSGGVSRKDLIIEDEQNRTPRHDTNMKISTKNFSRHNNATTTRIHKVGFILRRIMCVDDALVEDEVAGLDVVRGVGFCDG